MPVFGQPGIHSLVDPSVRPNATYLNMHRATDGASVPAYNLQPTKEYIGRRKSSPGKNVSMLGPLGPLAAGRREIQI